MNPSALHATALSFRHPGAEKDLLHAIQLEVPRGSLTLLLGPNGAGKSTLIKLLCGLLEPTAGKVALEGTPLHALSGMERGKRIALVPQQAPAGTGFTVREMIAMARAPHLGILPFESGEDRRIVDTVLESFGLEPLRERDFDSCSGGERERVMLARAVALQPDYLLLDEPTSSQDPRQQGAVLKHLSREAASGRGVLMVTHDWNLAAAVSSPLYLLLGGHLYRGTLEALLAIPAVQDFVGDEMSITRTVEGRWAVLPKPLTSP